MDPAQYQKKVDSGFRAIIAEQVKKWRENPLHDETKPHMLADALTEGQAATLEAWLTNEVLPLFQNIIHAHFPKDDPDQIVIKHVAWGDITQPGDRTKPQTVKLSLLNTPAMRHILADMDTTNGVTISCPRQQPDLFEDAQRRQAEEQANMHEENDGDDGVGNLPAVAYLSADYDGVIEEAGEDDWLPAPEGSTLDSLIEAGAGVVRLEDGRIWDDIELQGFIGEEVEPDVETLEDEPTPEAAEKAPLLDTLDDARALGRKAFEQEQLIGANPYNEETELAHYSAFRGGYNEAEEAKAAEKKSGRKRQDSAPETPAPEQKPRGRRRQSAAVDI